MNKDGQRICDDSELDMVVGGSDNSSDQGRHSMWYFSIMADITDKEPASAMETWKSHSKDLADWEKTELQGKFFAKFGYYIDQVPSW